MKRIAIILAFMLWLFMASCAQVPYWKTPQRHYNGVERYHVYSAGWGRDMRCLSAHRRQIIKTQNMRRYHFWSPKK